MKGGDTEGKQIMEDGVTCSIYTEELWDDDDALMHAMGYLAATIDLGVTFHGEPRDWR